MYMNFEVPIVEGDTDRIVECGMVKFWADITFS